MLVMMLIIAIMVSIVWMRGTEVDANDDDNDDRALDDNGKDSDDDDVCADRVTMIRMRVAMSMIMVSM